MKIQHWHFVRGTIDLSEDVPDDQPNLDLFIARDRFATTQEAARAVADDIVQRYPDAKTHPDLPKVTTSFPFHPGSVFTYYPRYPNKDLVVIWRMCPCSGNCRKLLRTLRKQTRQLIDKIHDTQ